MSNYPVSGMYTTFYNSRTVFYDVNTVVINILEGKYNDNKIFAQIYTQNFFFFLLYFHTKISTESNYVQPTINTMHFQKNVLFIFSSAIMVVGIR